MPNGNGDTEKNPPFGDFDARLQFLLQSSESLHANLQELHERMDQQNCEAQKRNKEVDARFGKILTATENLLTIVQSRQDRLDKRDGGKH